MNNILFSNKELLFIKDYCIDMINLFDENDMIEKNENIFLNNTENLSVSKNEIVDLVIKINDYL